MVAELNAVTVSDEELEKIHQEYLTEKLDIIA